MEIKLIESIRSTIRRPWAHVVTSLRPGKEHFPIEDDPVGEFLERKKAEVRLTGEEDSNEQPAESAAPEQSGERAVGKAADSSLQQAEITSGAGLTGDIIADKLPPSGEEKVMPAKSEAHELPAKSPEEAQSKLLEPVAQSVETLKSPEEKTLKDDKDADSILEIFKSEVLALDQSTPLVKELRDMNVYSLLEESKKIASKVKSKKKPTESS